jgi:hypothetical protein
MKMLPSSRPARTGPTPPVLAAPDLEMRTIDPRKLGQALKRFCSGKLVELSQAELPLSGPGMPGRPAWAR